MWNSRRLWVLTGPLALVLLWWFIAELGRLSPLLLPSPISVIHGLLSLMVDHRFARDLWWTLVRVSIGFLVGTTTGILVGLALGRNRILFWATEGLIDFFRSIPVTSLLPLFLTFFGVGDQGKIAVAAYACFLVNLFNTSYGVKNASRIRLLVAQTMGARRRQLFQKVVLPDAAPHIVVGLRLSASGSLVYIIVTEMFFGSTYGLGYRIYNANLTYAVPEMYACILVAGILGYALNRVLLVFENLWTHWVGR